MNILQVIPFFSMKYGGGVEVCVQLSSRLRDLGHEVTIITSDQDFDPNLARKYEGITIIPFRSAFCFASFVITPALRKWISQNVRHFDLVHLHDFRTYQNIVCSRVAIKNQVPYVISPHGSVPVVLAHAWKKRGFDFLFKKGLIENASCIVANSQSEYRNLVKTGASLPEVQVIYNGVSSPGTPTDKERSQFREKYSIPSDYFLFMGRLDRTKGLGFLVRGYRALLQKRRGSVPDLVIAGPPGNASAGLEADLEKLGIREHVRLLPFLEGTEKDAAYSGCLAFLCVPEYDSGVLLAPAEALLHGKPVVVTRECSELFEAGKGGFILDYGDIQAFTDMVSNLLDHLEEGASQAKAGCRAFQDAHTWKTVAQECEALYQKVSQAFNE